MKTDYSRLEDNFEHPYPLLFLSVGGARLYGFPGEGDAFELRGVHCLPLENLLGLEVRDEVVSGSVADGDCRVELSTFDAGRFFAAMLKRNGFVLEQLYSPLLVRTTSGHDKLKNLGAGCITRFHSHYYLGLAKTHWKAFEKDGKHRSLQLLHAYRAILAGMWMMRHRTVESNIGALGGEFRLSFLDDLLGQLRENENRDFGVDVEFHRREFWRLLATLESECDKTTLPNEATVKKELDELLIALRLCNE